MSRSATCTPKGFGPTSCIFPVVGFGDGGVFTTVGDVHRLWHALADDRFERELLATLSTPPTDDSFYGMGVWLDERPGVVNMEGMDAGASFTSTRLEDGTVFTVISNTTDGAWPVARGLRSLLDPSSIPGVT